MIGPSPNSAKVSGNPFQLHLGQSPARTNGMTTDTSSFGALLRRYRLSANFSQQALAERANLSVDAIAALERGRRRAPRPDTVALLAEALDLAAAERAALIAAAAQARADPGAPAAAAQARPPAVALRGFSPQQTLFIGRAEELARIARRLGDADCHLLTLLGPGGIGKTRLAIQAATLQAPVFTHGAAFVALGVLAAPDQLVVAVGEALGLSFAGLLNPLSHLLGALREQQLLLVLDNFEHLLDGAELVSAILHEAPQVRILITSRERLNLQAEWVFDLQGLTYPPAGSRPGDQAIGPAQLADYSAIQLFAQQAARVQPQFALSAATIPSIIRICQQVEGMPLAIELAAAWTRTLSAAEIERQIAAGLDFLATTLRDKPARHRSLRAVFDQSWNLLGEPERALLARLAVFRGGCAEDAATQVAEATPQLLAALIDKSLLRREPAEDMAQGAADAGGAARFGMLEPIREYALEQLVARGEAEALRQVHAAYYLALAEAAAQELHSLTNQTWLARLAREHENMRTALAWSLAEEETRRQGDEEARDTRHEIQDRSPASSLQSLVFGLGSWVSRSPSLPVSLSRRELGLRLASALGRFWLIRGHAREGRDWLARLLADGDISAESIDADVRALALREAALLAQAQDDFAEASALFAASAVLPHEEGPPHDLTTLLVNAAMLARNEGDYRVATALLEDCLAQQSAGGNRASIAQGGLGLVLFRLGLVLREQGAYARATALYDECLDLHRELADRSGVAVALLGLGDLARDQGDTPRMCAYCEESLALFRDVGEQWGIGFSLNNLALAAYRTGDQRQAAILAVESLALFRSLGIEPGVAEALTTWASVLAAGGEIARAHALLLEALTLIRTQGPQWLIANQLEDLAALAQAEGQASWAAQLCGAAASLRAAIGVPLPLARREEHERLIGAVRAALGPEAWQRAWQTGQALRLAQIIHSS
jgi:predicted ATPase/DNA-binding XRE family transcriptional regulator